MKTAEELLENVFRETGFDITDSIQRKMVLTSMKIFAEMHIEQFKKEIKDKAWHMCEDDGWDWHVEVDRVSNLYPPENIV